MDGDYVYKEGGGPMFNFHFVFRNTSLMVKKKQDSQYILYYTWHKDEKNSNLLWKMVVILMGSLF